MDTNPADFWKKENKYTKLSKLAKEVLGVPSSSAPVERLFSIAGKIFRPERCNLTDSRFEQLMFIRCNKVEYSITNYLKLHVLLGYYYFCSVLLIKLPISIQKH